MTIQRMGLVLPRLVLPRLVLPRLVLPRLVLPRLVLRGFTNQTAPDPAASPWLLLLRDCAAEPVSQAG